jgi:hypothetical protein
MQALAAAEERGRESALQKSESCDSVESPRR